MCVNQIGVLKNQIDIAPTTWRVSFLYRGTLLIRNTHPPRITIGP